jgi:curved DNA-binding protein CbpA
MSDFSKYFERIRVRPDPMSEAKAHAPLCQWDGCKEPGTHRAPVGRQREGEYFRFCFDHVREYNKSFNYFSGVSAAEIARFQKEALTGHRPTWTIASNGSARFAPDFSTKRSGRPGHQARMRDPFNLFTTRPDAAAAQQPKARPLEAKALETLGLEPNATGKAIKARYKELVKRHHPDANGGDRGSEDRFREVIQAYRMLKQSGRC